MADARLESMAPGSTVVVVMAKAPSGGAKTRLAPALGAAERVELARALLADRVDQVRAVSAGRPVVAFAPVDGAAEIAAIVGPDVALVAQRGADLGERLLAVVVDLFARGAGAVLLVDADSPTLPRAALEEACAVLGDDPSVDLVLGPAWDGGYWGIGMRRPLPALFAGISWSTRHVTAQTVAAARALGLRVHFLPAWFDVDTPADLHRLAGELAATSPHRPGDPRRTRAVVQRLVRPEVPAPRDERWRTLTSRLAYQNPWMRLHENVVVVTPGTLALYGVVTTSSCVGVLPLVDEKTALLVRQFRYVARRETWEIPTGGVHPGESIAEAAQRELREEAGVQAGRLEPLSTFHTSKSILDEVAHLFVGTQLESSTAEGDDTEAIDVHAVPLADAIALVESGEIVDAMSVIALLAAARRRGL